MERIDEITYYGPICAYGISRLVEITLEAISQKTSKIILRMDSEGGDLFAAFTAYEHLRSLNVPLETFNLNRIKDDALLPYLAGNERSAIDDAEWIFSGFGFGFGVDSIGLSAAIARKYDSELNRERFVKIVETRCQDSFQVRERLVVENRVNIFDMQTTRLDLSAALAAGIATRRSTANVINSCAYQWAITPASRNE